MRVAPEVIVPPQDHERLLKIARARSAPAHLKERANIVLLAAKGLQNIEIAEELGVTDRTVYKWRGRYIDLGIEGLRDAPRSGKPRTIPETVDTRILVATLQPPPNRTHWSTRELADHLGCSPSKVQRTWKQHGLEPHKVRNHKISNDKHFEDKLEDVVGLYLNPPENAIVFSVDEKSQIQALDRSQKILPIRRGLPEHQAWDYRRHGTLTLFAALDVSSGEVIHDIQARHRHQEFIAFLKRIDESTDPARDLHIILDNLQTHKTPEVNTWLEHHRRFHLHFIPTSSSWLNAVERLFRDLTTQRLKRGVFKNVDQLEAALVGWLDARNADPKPYKWTKTVEEILRKVRKYKRIYETLH